MPVLDLVHTLNMWYTELTMQGWQRFIPAWGHYALIAEASQQTSSTCSGSGQGAAPSYKYISKFLVRCLESNLTQIDSVSTYKMKFMCSLLSPHLQQDNCTLQSWSSVPLRPCLNDSKLAWNSKICNNLMSLWDPMVRSTMENKNLDLNCIL